MTLPQRKELAVANMHRLYEEYAHYDLMNTVRNAKIAQLDAKNPISFEQAMKNIGFTEVKDGFLQSSPRKIIFSVKYYALTQENYKNVLSNPKIDLSKTTLLKRYTDNTNFEYRLAYDISE